MVNSIMNLVCEITVNKLESDHHYFRHGFFMAGLPKTCAVAQIYLMCPSLLLRVWIEASIQTIFWVTWHHHDVQSIPAESVNMSCANAWDGRDRCRHIFLRLNHWGRVGSRYRGEGWGEGHDLQIATLIGGWALIPGSFKNVLIFLKFYKASKYSWCWSPCPILRWQSMELNNRDFLSILMSIAIIMNIMMSSSPPIFSFFYKKGKKKAAGKEMRDQEYLCISTEHWRKGKAESEWAGDEWKAKCWNMKSGSYVGGYRLCNCNQMRRGCCLCMEWRHWRKRQMWLRCEIRTGIEGPCSCWWENIRKVGLENWSECWKYKWKDCY